MHLKNTCVLFGTLHLSFPLVLPQSQMALYKGNRKKKVLFGEEWVGSQVFYFSQVKPFFLPLPFISESFKDCRSFVIKIWTNLMGFT